MAKVDRKLLAVGVAIGVLGFAASASAQDAPPSPAPSGASDAADSGEIVVTARKREERLQDVPLSISVVTQRNIEEQGITRFTDIVSRQPGLHLSEDGTQSSFSVRGISSATSADTTSATAGIYIDDYPLYDTWFRFASPDFRVFDVSRVEVLRGPQGTLYGATSLSGSIRVLTNKPDLDDFQAAFETTGSSTEDGEGNYALNGMVNIPIQEGRLGVRAVAYARRDGGWVDNSVRGDDVNSADVIGGRFYVGMQPAPDWNIVASVLYQRDERDDTGGTYYFPPPGEDEASFDSVLPTIVQSDLAVATLAVDHDIGDGNLNVTATYGYSASDNVGDGTPISTAFGLPVATPFTQPSFAHSQTIEARYSSDPSQAFRYVIGLYANTRYRSLRQNADQPGLAPFFGTGLIYEVYANQRATEIAAFGEGTWAFAPEWEATVGLRVFQNDYEFHSYVRGLLNSFVAPLDLNFTDAENSNTSATPRFSLSYKPNSDLNIYATVSQGYRFGLTNYNSGANTGIPLLYEPDTLWNYEAGIKATLFDGRGTLNSSVFYMDWRDIQLSFRNPNGQVYITNAGDARSYGIETELLLRPTPAWEINAALTLGTSELMTDNPGIQRRAASIRGPAVFGVQSGDRLPGSQEVSATLGVQYNIANIGPGDAYIRADDVYVGPSFVDFMEEGSLEIGDYNLLNLRLGYEVNNYEVVLFADNVLNDTGVVNAVPNGDLAGGDWAYRVHPRTIGVTFRARY